MCVLLVIHVFGMFVTFNRSYIASVIHPGVPTRVFQFPDVTTDTNGTSVSVILVGVNQVRDSRTSPTIDDIGGQTQEFLIDKSVRT